jgi:ribonucleotide reductase alpha subunit
MEFLRSSRYFHRLDMERIDWEDLAKSVGEEMPETYTQEEYMERMATRSGSMSNRDVVYDHLAAAILIELHERRTSESFIDVVRELQENRDVMGKSRPLLSEEFVEFIEANEDKIVALMKESECFLPSLFGWKTLARAYLLRSNGRVRERMVHMFMRVALFIHRDDWERSTRAFYDMMKGCYTHATPTLFHAGTRRSQMASCFTEDAEIWTESGRKKIVDVEIGDRVLSTHTGKSGIVLQKHKNLRGDRRLYKLFTEDRYVATATGDHEFYVRDSRTGVEGWKRLDCLTRTDELKRVRCIKSIHTSFIFVKYPITQRLITEYPRMAGMLFARLSTMEITTTTRYIDVELPSNHRSVYRMMADSIQWSRMQAGMMHIRESEIIDVFSNKETRHLLMKWCLESNQREFALGWEDVYLGSGGTFSAKNRMEANTWSMALSVLLDRDYRNQGVDIYMDHGGEDDRCLCFRKKKRATDPTNGFVRFTRRIRVQEEEKRVGYVYTLGIQGDHSYSVGGVIAKNCFLMGTEDSVTGIFKTLSDTAQISKWAGGIGVHISNIRASGSYISGTNGHSNGILPMLKVYNDVSRYIDQCFTPDVLVMTIHGMMPIGKIQKGDLVLNRLGEFYPVKKVLHYDWNGEMLCVNGARVTPEHSFLTLHDEYMQLSEMSDRDILVFPKPVETVEEEMNSQTIQFLLGCAYRWNIQDNGVMSVWEDPHGIAYNLLRSLFDEKDYMVIKEMINLKTRSLLTFLEEQMERAMHQSERVRKQFLIARREKEEEPLWMTRIMETMVYLERAGKQCISEMKMYHVVYEGRILDLEMEGDPSYVTQIGAVHNGGGKRSGAFAMYIEPWHADIMEFVLAKRNAGAEDERARDLFYGLWIPDLFMERVEKNEMWSLFCPSRAPHLTDSIGTDFRRLYTTYEEEKRYEKQIRARDLWTEILRSQIETGTPYMLYKDSCNYRSNQQNLGVIKSSNLCVVGDTRLLTPSGTPTIETLYAEGMPVHEVWNGSSFASVHIQKTGENQSVMRLEFSNGVQLTCTPRHRFYVMREGRSLCVEASGVEIHDILETYHLPSRVFKRSEIPEPVKRSMEWISRKHHAWAENLSVYSTDRDSLIELLLQLQWCGLSSIIQHHPGRDEFELRMDRDRIEKLMGFILDTEMNRNGEEMEVVGMSVKGVSVCRIDLMERQVDTYCFSEPETGRGLFQGVCTGQCTEIIEYSDDKEYAVCNLASIALPRFLTTNPKRQILERGKVVVYSKKDCPFCALLELETRGMGFEIRDIADYALEWNDKRRIHALTTVPAIFLDNQHIGGFTDVWRSHLCPVFDFVELARVVKALVRNLNRIIDLNVYPLPESEVSNKRHRPIGIGVQGLADVFGSMRLAFDEPTARILNLEIFETMYYAALVASNELAVVEGPYSTFRGSPLSKGYFHFELVAPIMTEEDKKTRHTTDRYDWETLRQKIIHHGVRNSLMIAPMPTASTSQILGNNECFEPWTSNIFLRRTNAGEFYVCNSFLRRDLEALGSWDEETMNRLILAQGSVAQFSIPFFLRNIYRTVWEIPQKSLIDMAADRQYFIDQSQSLNIFVTEPSFELLTKIHFYGWKKGLKTGCYYIRSRPPVSSINFTIASNTTTNECISCSA